MASVLLDGGPAEGVIDLARFGVRNEGKPWASLLITHSCGCVCDWCLASLWEWTGYVYTRADGIRYEFAGRCDARDA